MKVSIYELGLGFSVVLLTCIFRLRIGNKVTPTCTCTSHRCSEFFLILV
jgi:hypothetical protein